MQPGTKNPADWGNMRGFIQPMKANSADRTPRGDGWVTDLKWDGMRLQVAIDGDEIRLFSGSGRDVTSHFPELHSIVDEFDADHIDEVVLDGECVVFDGGRPSFQRLQHRIHASRPTAALLAEHPVFFVAFDLLSVGGNDLFAVAFEDRRRILGELLGDGPGWRVPPYSDGDPDDLLDLARDRGLEGIVCKRVTSAYRPGERSPDWLKIKIRLRQEFVVGGWLPGSGGLAGSLGSLLVGVHDPGHPGELAWAGAVGSGLSDRLRTSLKADLVASPTCPFAEQPVLDRPPTWVEPTTVVEVEFSLWPLGAQLWHPTFRGIRVDRDPADVHREIFAGSAASHEESADPVDGME